MSHSKAQQIITQACGAESWLAFLKFCGDNNNYGRAVVLCRSVHHPPKEYIVIDEGSPYPEDIKFSINCGGYRERSVGAVIKFKHELGGRVTKPFTSNGRYPISMYAYFRDLEKPEDFRDVLRAVEASKLISVRTPDEEILFFIGKIPAAYVVEYMLWLKHSYTHGKITENDS